MGEWKHRLSDVDPVGKTATCSLDGPVDIYYYERSDGGRVMRCKKAAKKSKKQHEYRPGEHRMISKDAETKTGICFTCGEVQMTRVTGTLGCPNRGYKGHKLKMRTELRSAIRDGKPCEICGKVDENMALDHKHGENTWRGILCFKHNTGLGMFDDDPKLLRAAAEYLERPRND